MFSLQRSRIFLTAGVLLALALSARAAEVDKYLPNDSHFVVTINVKQILNSEVVKKHGTEPVKKTISGNDEVTQVLSALGFDPLRDITSITLGAQGLFEKGLLIVHGNFDTAKFHAKADKIAKEKSDMLKVHKVDNHRIYETVISSEEGTWGALAKLKFISLVNATTLVGSGNMNYIVEAFDKESGKKKTKLENRLQDLVQKADGKHSVWAVAPSSEFAPAAALSEEVKSFVDKFNSLCVGVTLTGGVKASFIFAAKDDKSAKDLAGELRDRLEQAKGLLAAAGDNKMVVPVMEFLESIKVANQGAVVTLKGEVKAESIEKALKKD